MIRGLAVLVVFQFVGDCLGALFPLGLPGSVVGMGLLALALHRGLVAAETVRPVADVLTRNMAFFFVPAGVGVVLYTDLVRREALPIVVASVVSTLAVMACVGRIAQRPEEA